jgi:probable HAF family extracellular repeat protein
MKSTLSTLCVAMAFFGATVPSSVAAQSSRAHGSTKLQYSVVEVGGLGGTFTILEGTNQEGSSTGYSWLSGNTAAHAVLWKGRRIQDLGTLGGPDSVAYAINDRNFAGGLSETSTSDPLGEDFCGFGTYLICSAVIWHRGKITALPTLGGNNAIATYNLPDNGQVPGEAETATMDSTCSAPQVLGVEGVVWGPKHNQIQPLSPLSGDPDSAASQVNDRGIAVGTSGSCAEVLTSNGGRSVLWKDGVVTALGSLGGTTNAAAEAVNNRDEIVGVSNLPGDATHHAFLWQRGVMRDLGTLPGDLHSAAEGINDTGQIVGVSSDPTADAVLWQHGRMLNLNDLVPSDAPAVLITALAITPGGVIAGYGVDKITGNVVGCVAVPNAGTEIELSTPSRRLVLTERQREQLRKLGRFGRPGLANL